MAYFFRHSRFEQLIRILEVLVDIALLIGLILLTAKLWPVISIVFHILTWIAHHLGC
jgi:hypothetical protein